MHYLRGAGCRDTQGMRRLQEPSSLSDSPLAWGERAAADTSVSLQLAMWELLSGMRCTPSSSLAAHLNIEHQRKMNAECPATSLHTHTHTPPACRVLHFGP